MYHLYTIFTKEEIIICWKINVLKHRYRNYKAYSCNRTKTKGCFHLPVLCNLILLKFVRTSKYLNILKLYRVSFINMVCPCLILELYS